MTDETVCDYHDLPLEPGGWHIVTDPVGAEPAYRVLCALAPVPGQEPLFPDGAEEIE